MNALKELGVSDAIGPWTSTDVTLPVMLFHAGFKPFSGGYVGVDLFFVISGFLITSIILNERLSGRFSIMRFYERRARRILPALFFVMLVCLPLAWFWMLPQELAGFGRSLVAVSTFVSNILFWRTTGYFDLAAEEKPLLHTWSLGVEEQYYVVFPLVMAFFWRLGVRRLAALLAVLACASFLSSEWLLSRDAVASFFLAPTRAWELFAGALLAFAVLSGPPAERVSRGVQEGLGLFGLVLILVPVFAFDGSTAFPGTNGLPPVIGTLLVLAFATPQTWAGRFLTLRAMLWVGTISYSAYLWHQPLFAFARLMNANQPLPWVFASLIVLSLGLAHLSWKFVENPFRDSRRWSRKAILLASVAVSASFIGLGAWLIGMRGVPDRWSPQAQRFVAPDKTRIEGCPAVDAWLHVCLIGAPDRPRSIVLVGDSHAYAITPALDEALARAGVGGYVVHTSCHPIPGLFDSREPLTPQRVAFCAEADRRLRAFVGQPDVKAIIVAIRWTARLYPMDDGIDAPAFDNHEGGIEGNFPFRRNITVNVNGQGTDAAAPKARALIGYLNGLASQRTLAVLYPVPEVGWTPARLNLIAMATGDGPPAVISTSWARMQERNAVVARLLDAADSPIIRRSRPESLLCNTVVKARCVVQARGELYYADENHLSTLGSRLVVDDLLRQLGLEQGK